MMAMGTHCVDLLHFLLGQDIVEVAALTDGQRRDSPLEHLATMCVRFNGGTLGMVGCGSRMPDSKNDATLYGSHGRMILGDSLRTALQGSLEVVSDTVNTTMSYEQDTLALYKRQIEAHRHSKALLARASSGALNIRADFQRPYVVRSTTPRDNGAASAWHGH